MSKNEEKSTRFPVSTLTGFLHLSTADWLDLSKFYNPPTSDHAFITELLLGHEKPGAFSEYLAEYYRRSNTGKTSESLHSYLGMAKMELSACSLAIHKADEDLLAETLQIIIDQRRVVARVSCFYLLSATENTLYVSFGFCSPEDVKIGGFSKSNGRLLAFRRFYGIDGEQLGRVGLRVGPEFQTDIIRPGHVILAFLEEIGNGRYTVVTAVQERAANIPRIMALDNDGEESTDMLVSIDGIIKVPHWLIKAANPPWWFNEG